MWKSDRPRCGSEGQVWLIVPVYNSEEYLKQCIDSILRQTYKNIEIILVNDGSQDRSEDICREYVDCDNRVVYVKQSNNGVSSARNQGIKKSSGKYIAFVDSDDCLTEDAIEILYTAQTKCNADLVIAAYIRKYATNNICLHIDNNIILEESIPLYFADHFLEAIASSVWGKLYKRNKIYNLFDENLTMGEDLLFNLEYIKSVQSVSSIDKCIYVYNCANTNSLVTNYKTNYFAQDIIVCSKWVGWLEECGLADTQFVNIYYKVCQNYFASILTAAQSKNNYINVVKSLSDPIVDQSIKKTIYRFNFLQKDILKSASRKHFSILYYKLKIYNFIKHIKYWKAFTKNKKFI